MTRHPEQEVRVSLRIEIWSGSVLLHAYQEEQSVPLNDNLRFYARQLHVPVETAAFLLAKKATEHTVRAVPPSTFGCCLLSRCNGLCQGKEARQDEQAASTRHHEYQTDAGEIPVLRLSEARTVHVERCATSRVWTSGHYDLFGSGLSSQFDLASRTS
jgi:hypothetical protein